MDADVLNGETVSSELLVVTTIDVPSVTSGDGELWADTEFHFADGTAALVCEGIVFRVHRGILCMNSPVFESLLSAGKIDDSCTPDWDTCGEEWEGCRVYRLPDSAGDMRHLLRALYRRSYFKKGTPTDFAVLSSLLRLSTKYNVQHLRADLVEHLKLIYPSKLSAFRATQNSDFSLFNDKDPRCHILAVSMARENHVEVILPAALYFCCRTLSVAKVLDGILDSDGSPLILPAGDQRLALIGRGDLIRLKHTTSNSFMMRLQTSTRCEDPMGCHDTLVDKLSEHLPRWDSFWTACTPFQKRAQGKSTSTLGVCESCAAEWKDAEKDGHEEVWERLPGVFGLPSWAELQEKQMSSEEALCVSAAEKSS